MREALSEFEQAPGAASEIAQVGYTGAAGMMEIIERILHPARAHLSSSASCLMCCAKRMIWCSLNVLFKPM